MFIKGFFLEGGFAFFMGSLLTFFFTEEGVCFFGCGSLYLAYYTCGIAYTWITFGIRDAESVRMLSV